MVLDANTTAKMIRQTIERLKTKNRKFEKNEAGSLILTAFEELAAGFESITERARAEAEVAARSSQR